MLQDFPAEWEGYLNFARSITTSFDLTDFMSDPNQTNEQAQVVGVLQKLAFHDADSGGVQDLADWCQRQWLKLLENHPDQLEALKGRPPSFSHAKSVV